MVNHLLECRGQPTIDRSHFRPSPARPEGMGMKALLWWVYNREEEKVPAAVLLPGTAANQQDRLR